MKAFGARKWFKRGVAPAGQGRLEEARDAYLRAAEAGDVDAQYKLGLVCVDLGERADAIRWLRRAAEAGDVGAMRSLGRQLLGGDREEIRESLRWYAKACGDGHAPSQYDLGLDYQSIGELPLAERFFEKAAKQGHLEAEVSLAELWLGRGCRSEAEDILRRAAEKGHPRALAFMADLAREGGDTERAARFYRDSYRAGFSGAAVNLGLMYEKQGSLGEAEDWLGQAAADGNTSGMYALGRLLVRLDRRDEAVAQFREAAGLGDEAARRALWILVPKEEEE
ncbi:tetratricopeptide repeat protein [Streptomyces galilaeus]